MGRAENEVRQLDRRIRRAREDLNDLKREIEERESAENSDPAAEEGKDDKNDKKSGDDKAADDLKQMYRELGTIEGALEGWFDERIDAVVEYRYAVDEARRRGFAEVYRY